MPITYCEICGVLIPNGAPGETICERCYATRKTLVSSDVNAPNAAPERVRFPCPSCLSLLQLPPVKKRTKIVCPSCSAEFYMHENGEIELREQGRASSQSELIGDMKPEPDRLENLLGRVPEKADALPPALVTERYELAVDESQDELMIQDIPPSPSSPTIPVARAAPPPSALPPMPRALPPMPRAPAPPPPPLQPTVASGGLLLADSSGDLTVNREAIDAALRTPPPKIVKEKASSKRLTSQKRMKNAVETRRRKKEERAERLAQVERMAAEMQAESTGEGRSLVRLAYPALVLAPLVLGGALLASTVQDRGFASGDTKIAHGLADLGDIVRSGIQGWEGIFTGK